MRIETLKQRLVIALLATLASLGSMLLLVLMPALAG